MTTGWTAQGLRLITRVWKHLVPRASHLGRIRIHRLLLFVLLLSRAVLWVLVRALARSILPAHEEAILAVQELGLQEAEAGVLQVVHAQELGTADDLADVFSAE